MVHCIYIEGSQVFLNKIVFFSLKTIFILVHSLDLDEIVHHAAFHLGLHCLPNYAFSSQWLDLKSKVHIV